MIVLHAFFIKYLTSVAKVKSSDEYKDAIQQAWEAKQRPDFYRSIGIDPDQAYEAGLVALKARYSI